MTFNGFHSRKVKFKDSDFPKLETLRAILDKACLIRMNRQGIRRHERLTEKYFQQAWKEYRAQRSMSNDDGESSSDLIDAPWCADPNTYATAVEGFVKKLRDWMNQHHGCLVEAANIS
jgi:hypothetical protein